MKLLNERMMQMQNAYEKAAGKLQRIIEHEGDAGGARLTPAYFLELLEEELRIDACERFFSAKKEGDKN